MCIINRNEMSLPQNVKYVLNTIEAGGFEAYVVGGCVRNRLMGKQPEDYDITTSAKPEDIKSLFPKTFDTGIKHGTVTVVSDKTNIEVTSYRIDGKYTDNRRPENVTFTTDLSLDLERRDFTMNAIAYGAKTGFVDLFNGMADIENKLIRGVGEPGKRYNEDALRMLRAVRFAGQLGFEIERETYDAINKNASLIKNISAERIRDEFVKTVISAFPEKLQMMPDTGLSENIDGGLDEYLKKSLNSVLPAVKLCEKRPCLRLALLLQNMEYNRIKALLGLLKFDNKLMKDVLLYTEWLNKDIPDECAQLRKILSVLGHDAFKDIIYLKSVKAASESKDISLFQRISSLHEQIIRNNDCVSMPQLKINGDTLIKMGFTRGMRLGEVLNHLFDTVLSEPDKNDDAYLRAEALRLLSVTYSK